MIWSQPLAQAFTAILPCLLGQILTHQLFLYCHYPAPVPLQTHNALLGQGAIAVNALKPPLA
jgi:hypothetical protein